jgi:hypothetical protein
MDTLIECNISTSKIDESRDSSFDLTEVRVLTSEEFLAKVEELSRMLERAVFFV